MISQEIIDQAERFRRPSNIARLAACPGQAIMAAAATLTHGEPPAAAEARIGNDVHAAVADGVAYALGICRGDWAAAANLAADKAAARLMDSWSVNCIRATLEFYQNLAQKYDIEADHILAEHDLDMSGAGFMRKGTSDLVLVRPFDLVIIVDLKAGFVDQGDAADHDQMATYAAAAAATFEAPRVIVYLFQPRADRDRRATAAEFDAIALRETAAWSRSVLDASRKPTAALRAGYTQCSTCPALRNCPAAKEYIMNAQEAIACIGNPQTPEAWGEAIGAAKLAEKWAETWKDAGKAHLIGGGTANGFKLGAGRAIRSVANVPEAIAKLRAAGLESEALSAATIAIGKLTPQAIDVIAEHITQKTSDPSLVADKAKP